MIGDAGPVFTKLGGEREIAVADAVVLINVLTVGGEGGSEDVAVLGGHGKAIVRAPVVAVHLTQDVEFAGEDRNLRSLTFLDQNEIANGHRVFSIRSKGEGRVIRAGLFNRHHDVIGGPCRVPCMIACNLELELDAFGQLKARLDKLVGAVALVNHVVGSVCRIPLGAKYGSWRTGYRVTGDGGWWSHIAINLELHGSGNKGDHILFTRTGELVCAMIAARLLR